MNSDLSEAIIFPQLQVSNNYISTDRDFIIALPPRYD